MSNARGRKAAKRPSEKNAIKREGSSRAPSESTSEDGLNTPPLWEVLEMPEFRVLEIATLDGGVEEELEKEDW